MKLRYTQSQLKLETKSQQSTNPMHFLRSRHTNTRIEILIFLDAL